MSLNSSKRVSMGAALQCDYLKGLWPALVGQGGQGSKAEDRLLGEELLAVWQRGSPGSCSHSATFSSLQRRRVKKLVIFLRAVCKVKQQEERESEVCLCSRALAKGRCVHLKLEVTDISPASIFWDQWGDDVFSLGVLHMSAVTQLFSGCTLTLSQLNNKLYSVGRDTIGGRVPGAVNSIRNGSHLKSKWQNPSERSLMRPGLPWFLILN